MTSSSLIKLGLFFTLSNINLMVKMTLKKYSVGIGLLNNNHIWEQPTSPSLEVNCIVNHPSYLRLYGADGVSPNLSQ